MFNQLKGTTSIDTPTHTPIQTTTVRVILDPKKKKSMKNIQPSFFMTTSTRTRTRSSHTLIIFLIMSMSTLHHIMVHGFTTKPFSFSTIIISKYSQQHSTRTRTFQKKFTSSASSLCTYYRSNKNKSCLFQYYHNSQFFRLFASTTSSSNSDSDDSDDDNDNYLNKKARVLFLGTPDVAATTLKTIVEASQNENW